MSAYNLAKLNISRAPSGKLTIIDQSIYEQFRQETKPVHRIKNCKFKKSQRVYNLSQFIKSKGKKKKTAKPIVYSIYKHEKKSISKKKRKKSKLKKRILKYRLLKKDVNENTTKEVKLLTTSEGDDITICLKNLSLRDKRIPGVHSRRFREYCDNTTSQSFCNLVETLLRELNRFQKRAFQCNIYKGRNRRRLVVGFREVQVQMRINKIKFVVIATDCEVCDLEGGLDEIIKSMKEDCRNSSIPCAFAFQRRQLGYILFKQSPISCVGVLDYDGAQEIFFKIISSLETETSNYKCLLKKNKI